MMFVASLTKNQNQKSKNLRGRPQKVIFQRQKDL